MPIGEIIFIVLLAGGLLIPSALAHQWWLFTVFLVFFGIFGFLEWLSMAKTGLSISQQFWKYSSEHPKGAWGVIIGMLVGWLALLSHLGRNLFKKKDPE